MYGTGPAALARAEDLVACGARVARGAMPLDATQLAGVFLVVVERDVGEIDAAEIAAAARSAHALVHAVDRPAMSDLALPAVLRRGRLSVAVSTSGASPVLAQRLRDEIGKVLPAELADVTEKMVALRERLRGAPLDERVKAQREALAGLELTGTLKLPGDRG